MTLKPSAKNCVIKEQIIEDPCANLIIQFSSRDNGGCNITLYRLDDNEPILPFGNRDIGFDSQGEESDGGTATSCRPRPSWIREVYAPEEEAK